MHWFPFVRDQQFILYGSYDLPFGKGKQIGSGANRATNLLIGGLQLSWVLNRSGGLPFSLSYSNFGGTQDCNHNVGCTAAPCRPNASGHMKTQLSGPTFSSGGTIRNPIGLLNRRCSRIRAWT